MRNTRQPFRPVNSCARARRDMMTMSSDPSHSKTIFASGDVAKKWQRGKAFRDEVNAAANEIMFDLANLGPGNRVLDIAAGTGDQTLMAAQRVGPDRVRISDRSFYKHVELSCRCGERCRPEKR